MSTGFKLKKLVKELAELNSNNSDSGPSKAAINLQNAIDETRSVWEFEKSSLQLDLESTESEYGIVKNQLERTMEIANAEKARNAAGVSSNDLAKTELARLDIERQLLQLRSRLAGIKKSLDWMAKFEETVLKQSESVLER
jgi:CII-binding regulator of phage lambda lysogenization HflD